MHNPNTFFPMNSMIGLDTYSDSLSLDGPAKYMPDRNMGNGVYSSMAYERLVDKHINIDNGITKRICKCQALIDKIFAELDNIEQSSIKYPKGFPTIFQKLYCSVLGELLQKCIEIRNIVNNEIFFGERIVGFPDLTSTIRLVYQDEYSINGLRDSLKSIQQQLNYIKICYAPLYKDKVQDKFLND